jgi:hypothetical protein
MQTQLKYLAMYWNSSIMKKVTLLKFAFAINSAITCMTWSAYCIHTWPCRHTVFTQTLKTFLASKYPIVIDDSRRSQKYTPPITETHNETNKSETRHELKHAFTNIDHCVLFTHKSIQLLFCECLGLRWKWKKKVYHECISASTSMCIENWQSTWKKIPVICIGNSVDISIAIWTTTCMILQMYIFYVRTFCSYKAGNRGKAALINEKSF